MSASGPLVARWRTLEHGPIEAGALQRATVEVENAGSATWRTRGPDEGLFLAYHWLDARGNPIVWDGYRTALERPVPPGEALRQEMALRGPIPPGRYRLALDLLEEHRFWLAELGGRTLESDVEFIVAALLVPWFFLTPIIYPLSGVPGAGNHPHVIQAIHWANPLSPGIEAVRAPLFLGELPAWGDALYLVVACAVALALGAFVFTRVDDQIAIEV